MTATETVPSPATPSEHPACARAAVTAWGVQSPLVAGCPFSAYARAKSLDGAPLADAELCVVDERGEVVARARLAAGADGEVAPVEFALTAPGATGPHAWGVVVLSGGRTLARRPLPFSVTPALTRPARVTVADAATGKPLPDASAFFYMRGLMRTKPVCYVSNAEGVVEGHIAPGAVYNVRVEALGHAEGYCRLEAGDDACVAAGEARLAQSSFDDDQLVTRGRTL